MARGAASLLHVDLDAFYASVEVLRRPALAGRPVAVGGGVVLSATYEARRCGVQSGMRIAEARTLCPALVVVGGSFADYVESSRRVMQVLRRFTPVVEPISIDEAFLDVGGSMHLFGDPLQIAGSIRREIRAATGLPASVGAATTRFLAKVAGRVAKPDGIVVVEPGTEIAFLHPLPVGHLWGVGPVTGARLDAFGIRTVGDLAAIPADALCSLLGKRTGRHLHALAWNLDPRPVEGGRRAGSVGAQSAFGGGADPGEHRRILLRLADRVGTRLRAKGRAGRTVTLRLRFADYTAFTRRSTLPGPTASTTAIHRAASRLLEAAVAETGEGRGLSLLGISVSHLTHPPGLQMELPLTGECLGDPLLRPGSQPALARRALDDAADAARAAFGRDAVSRAALLGPARPAGPTGDHLPEPEDL